MISKWLRLKLDTHTKRLELCEHAKSKKDQKKTEDEEQKNNNNNTKPNENKTWGICYTYCDECVCVCVSMMRVRADELMKSYVVFETKYIS